MNMSWVAAVAATSLADIACAAPIKPTETKLKAMPAKLETQRSAQRFQDRAKRRAFIYAKNGLSS